MTRIIYPEDRTVSDETIRGWYLDALTDNLIVEQCDPEDILAMATLLEDIGIITVGRS